MLDMCYNLVELYQGVDMGRATEAMFYGKHGFKPEFEELYAHIETISKEERAKMAKIRRESKKV